MHDKRDTVRPKVTWFERLRADILPLRTLTCDFIDIELYRPHEVLIYHERLYEVVLIGDEIEGYMSSTVCVLCCPPSCRKGVGPWSEVERDEMGGLHKSKLAIFVIDSALKRRVFMARQTAQYRHSM